MARTRKTKDFNPGNCPVTHALNRIGGHWKILIIYGISKGLNRFTSLQKGLPLISKQTLVNQLRELEEDGILQRTAYAEVPPRVEYSITEHGRSLVPIIMVMQEWGMKDMQRMAEERVHVELR